MIKVMFILLITLNIYGDDSSEKNINSHNPYNYSYQTHNPGTAALYLVFDGLFNTKKFFGLCETENKKNKSSELKTDFEYLEEIDKNMKEASE